MDLLYDVIGTVFFYFLIRSVVGIPFKKAKNKPHHWGAIIWLFLCTYSISVSLADPNYTRHFDPNDIFIEHFIGYCFIAILPAAFFAKRKLKKAYDEE